MVSTSIDPAIIINPSESLKTFLHSITLEGNPPPRVVTLVEGGDTTLTSEDLKWLKNCGQCPKLGESLLKSSLTLPSPVYPERDPELEERTQRLRIEQNEREYRRMTANVSKGTENSKYQDEESISSQMKEINSYLVLILQFVVSVATSFLFGYMAPYYFWGKHELGARLLVGILCAFVVGCADMYFVIRHMLEQDGVIQIKKIQ